MYVQCMHMCITRKMISSGGASLRSWHQLYSRVFICKDCHSFESLTGQAIKHNQMTELEQPGSQFGHHS